MYGQELQGQKEQLDFDACLFITARYMAAQNWQLIDARSLVERFWPDLQGRGLQGRQAQEAVERAVWQDYAALLYDSCRRAEDVRADRAWSELHHWMAQQARGIVGQAQEREDVVQEALISLHAAFQSDSLQAPRALWAFALQALRNTAISRHRLRATKKRGQDKVESLEENQERRQSTPPAQSPLTTEPGAPQLRPLEETVINRDRRRQLQAFFEQHLKSELQLTVARAFYLENQTPAEIAALLGKSPHEIRMVKSRIVRTLRSLPPPEMERLLSILDAPSDESQEDTDVNA